MGITKVAANAAVGSGAKVAAGSVGVSEGPDAVLKGKRPLPVGRGRALGALITSELHHATNVLQDSFLHRAILRLLQRPLTVLITNLTQQVTQLLLAPEFAPAVSLVLNATQVHALAYSHFASELLETFDALGLGCASSRGSTSNDGLRPLKEGLENVVFKFVGPLISAIKSEVFTVINELEKEPSVGVATTAFPTAITPLSSSTDQRSTRPLPASLHYSLESRLLESQIGRRIWSRTVQPRGAVQSSSASTLYDGRVDPSSARAVSGSVAPANDE